MSERRIWLEYAPWKDDGRGGYEWTATKGDINPDDNIEYVRADLAAEREWGLEEALRGIKWISCERDNMEFQTRITCYQLDKIRNFLADHEQEKDND